MAITLAYNFIPISVASSLSFERVELEGIEPSSKQGRPVLSTRLSQPSVFERKQDLGHQSAPYPLNLTYNARPL